MHKKGEESDKESQIYFAKICKLSNALLNSNLIMRSA